MKEIKKKTVEIETTPYRVPRNIYYTPSIIFFLQLQGPQPILRAVQRQNTALQTLDSRHARNNQNNLTHQ